MIELADAKITNGLPRVVANQTWVQVLAAVYNALRAKSRGYFETTSFPDVENCTEDVLDQLAVYLKIEWYDSHASIETKRKTVLTAVEIRRYAGTVKAVRDQARVVYPGSEVEEWFEYGGTPGLWRLNVNITDTPTLYHTVDEMEDLLGYTKRCSTHLERISYMVRHAIEIGREIESWTFCPPLCGTIRCGTWWMPSTLGWSERGELRLADRSGYYAVSPEFTGTLPDVATPGWSVCGAVLCGGWADSYTAAPAEANTADCGTLWMPSTLGWSERQQVQAEGRVDCIAVQPELTGTLPDAATQGYSICGATACGGAAKGYKVSPKLTGTLPRKEGEDE